MNCRQTLLSRCRSEPNITMGSCHHYSLKKARRTPSFEVDLNSAMAGAVPRKKVLGVADRFRVLHVSGSHNFPDTPQCWTTVSRDRTRTL